MAVQAGRGIWHTRPDWVVFEGFHQSKVLRTRCKSRTSQAVVTFVFRPLLDDSQPK